MGSKKESEVRFQKFIQEIDLWAFLHYLFTSIDRSLVERICANLNYIYFNICVPVMLISSKK